MARRPDDTAGYLIFQEGKCIEGDYYVIAVYDDPSECTISFSAYELENDCTYTYPLTYSEFDAIFKFDSELMNPSNQDGRFHWVIERLDFVQDNRGQKVLCLAQEPTPEADDEEELVQDTKKATSIAPAAVGGGKIDAATRAKLIKELDTQDDEKLHVSLVRSEGARKRFLAELHARRQLEQLKASQRLQKADEEREARLAKLDIIRQQQAAKAMQHREKEEAKKSTMQMLEVLMKQKEAQAIRRLIQEKDEKDRGMGREKDAARQRRKMQERSAAERKAIEDTKAKQLGRRRDEQVVIRERKIMQVNRELAEKVFEYKAEQRKLEIEKREEKDKIIEAEWARKREERREKEKQREEFEAMEDVRERLYLERETRRAMDEREYLFKQREIAAAEEAATQQRRSFAHKELMLQWKVDASKRAVAERDHKKREVRREKKVQEAEEARLRRFRETQFLESMQRSSLSPPRRPDAEDEEGSRERSPSQPPATTAGAEEMQAFQRTYEQQERQRRHAEREERRRIDDAKKDKLQQLKGKDPNTVEILRAQEWRKETQAQKERIEKAKLAKELAQEEEAQRLARKIADREETWERLETLRRARSRERELKRNEAAIRRAQGIPVGTALPQVLIY
mmetsp:Transcript_43584/g.121131  ORF Transcript_43584/g.121131 Transcript_43584/m.121131 type:complete len:628 (-) Transcript_43584:77-1960(-)